MSDTTDDSETLMEDDSYSLTTSREFVIPQTVNPVAMLGVNDAHVRYIEQACPGLRLVVRGHGISVLAQGEQAERCVHRVLDLLHELVREARMYPVDESTVTRLLEDYAISSASQEQPVVKQTRTAPLSRAITMASHTPIRPKTAGQQAYVKAIDEYTITFGIGPAGCGKTYLAVAKAVQALKSNVVRRIILTRPVVEAGERLGFLPGGLQEKVDPYVRPLYDALGDMLGSEQVSRYMEKNIIEVAPLAYMRGRTLNDAFIILDEAQNTTNEQMKMFLTRLGRNAKMVVTGDITQVDREVGRSGLIDAERIVAPISDVACIHLSEQDVVRHSLVARIVKAYEEYNHENQHPSTARINDNIEK